MRVRLYVDGIPAWSANEPATGRMHHRLASFSQGGIGGQLVTGDPGAADKQRAAQREHMARKRAAKA